MEYIDTHCHLDADVYKDTLYDVVSRARDASVNRMITIGTSLQDCGRVAELTTTHDGIFAAVGLHPEDSVADIGNISDAVGLLQKFLDHDRVVAIGECGLDYSRGRDRAVFQRQLFEAQLDLATRHHLPVVLHVRDAHREAMEILRHFPHVTAVVHCFTADLAIARHYVNDFGFMISFTGIVTFGPTKVAALEEVARWIPDHHYFLETDAPFLAPVPYRGKTNEPSYIPLIAEYLATLRGQSLEHIAQTTTSNAERFFRLS